MDCQNIVMPDAARNRIILNESALLPRFSQDAYLICHKGEGERVLNAIKGLFSGTPSENVFVHGPSGSGKTAMVKWAVNQMEEQSRRVVCIYANCWRYSTSMAIYTKIADAFGEPVSRRGRASDEIFDHIVCMMKSSKRPILLVLDEIEALVHYDNARILHNIARVDEDRVLFGVIGISDSDAVLLKLPQKTREILRFTRIEVPRYTKDELLAILKERAAEGLRPGSYDDTILENIASIGSAAKGNSRFVLEILWRVARSSEDQGLMELSKDEIEAIKREIGIIGMELSREEHVIIDLLKEGQKTTTELYSLFWQRIPRTKRQIRNYLRAMEQRGIIEIENVMAGNQRKYAIVRLKEGFR